MQAAGVETDIFSCLNHTINSCFEGLLDKTFSMRHLAICHSEQKVQITVAYTDVKCILELMLMTGFSFFHALIYGLDLYC